MIVYLLSHILTQNVLLLDFCAEDSITRDRSAHGMTKTGAGEDVKRIFVKQYR